jgi:hypothetical protein
MGCISIDLDEKAEEVILGRVCRTFMYCAYLQENDRVLYSRANITPEFGNLGTDAGVVHNGDLKTVLGGLRGNGHVCRSAKGCFTSSKSNFDFPKSVCLVLFCFFNVWFEYVLCSLPFRLRLGVKFYAVFWFFLLRH